ncbi:MAG: hypothetical protein HN348_04910 [Proteobacteria bacterium]|jgi:hypothetical protein|nr:hypothetical protein [Pseudomonadota bacterium]
MRHAVMVVALAFSPSLRFNRPGRLATRRLAKLVFAYLDHRRRQIDQAS